MALVLNAVAGARRSQRNNARAADVNQVAAGINQYIATRNELPDQWTDIQQIIDPSKFGHYDKATNNTNTSINPADGFKTNAPSSSDKTEFVQVYTGTAPSGARINSNSLPDPNNATTGSIYQASNIKAADTLIVLKQAGCKSTGNGVVEQGGIREMAIVYRLEGQTAPICLEV